MEATYKLKPMVAARLLAEVTALVILLFLPVLLLVHGDFFRIAWATQALCGAVSVVSLLVLPAYGFVTYKVSIDDEGLETFSLFKKQFARWEELKTIQLKTSWGWRRYVVKTNDDTDLNFPVWLNDVHQLCEAVRSRLPNRGSVSAGASAKVYNQSTSASVVTLVKVVLSLLFIGLFWAFFAHMHVTPGSAAGSEASDRMTILITCLIFTVFMLVRALFYAFIPRQIVTDADAIHVKTWFFSRSYPWVQLKSVSPPFFLLPEGLMVRTTGGLFVIGDQLDAFDELQEELAKRLPPLTVPEA